MSVGFIVGLEILALENPFFSGGLRWTSRKLPISLQTNKLPHSRQCKPFSPNSFAIGEQSVIVSINYTFIVYVCDFPLELCIRYASSVSKAVCSQQLARVGFFPLRPGDHKCLWHPFRLACRRIRCISAMLKPGVYVSVLELVESSKSGRFFAQAFEDEDAPPSAGDRRR